ncbi:MAG TPA: hypothetical protein VFG93_07980 [Gaiellaceae bacterium]|nr:hypothetical protein [Gaiellaceae bacterium]
MDGNLKLLRRHGRREIFRRPVLLCALVATFLVVPNAAAVPPEVTVTITGTLGLNGWYRSNVTVSWQVVGEDNSSPGCNTQTLITDTPGTKITCTASSGGDETSKSVTIKLDKTAPAVNVAASRPPDANGWYNHALTVAFSGTDATSGIASCSAAGYEGPDNPSAAVAGSCADNAGNSTGVSFPFKYDATAPAIFAVITKLGNRSALVTWRKSSDTQTVEVLRAPGRQGEGESVVYRGTATGFLDTGLAIGRKYEYRVTGIDQAANRSERAVNLVATGPLLSPLPGALLKGPATLDWIPLRRATYYNLQIVRGRKVLSAWPAQSSFRLRRTWSYNGRRYRLRPGKYRWYVWPGYGRISASHYGRLLGSSTFVVTK